VNSKIELIRMARKITSNLSDVVNIGADTESKLIQVGIDSYEKLVAAGTEDAFIRLQKMDPGACLCLLYGLDGAIRGIKASQLSPERKKELQQFHKMAQRQLL
jgi:DNA transformation protein and related proteins